MIKKALKIIFPALIILFLAWGGVLAAKKNQNNWVELKNQEIDDSQEKTEKNFVEKFWGLGSNQEEPVNFLILGASGPGYEAPDLTDAILVARFDPAKRKIFLFSIPRDLLVRIPDSQSFTKINALYAYAKTDGKNFEWIISKAEQITGLPIDHYIMVNLSALKELVDIFGGLNIQVKEDILDTKFPGPNYSYETFEMRSGWRYMDGETALKYARSRHCKGGDFDRISRQQEIIQALKQKILGLKIWDINKFVDIYQTISRNIKTDIGIWQMKNYWTRLKDLPGDSIIKNEINTDLLTATTYNLGGAAASVVVPKAGIEEYDNIKEYIDSIIR